MGYAQVDEDANAPGTSGSSGFFRCCAVGMNKCIFCCFLGGKGWEKNGWRVLDDKESPRMRGCVFVTLRAAV